jgi:uncharacterized protein (DUF433 family)
MDEPSLMARITVDPAVCHGKPCVRGLRYPVESLLGLFAGGMSADEILADYEDLEPDDLRACFLWATRLAEVKSLRVFAA